MSQRGGSKGCVCVCVSRRYVLPTAVVPLQAIHGALAASRRVHVVFSLDGF